MISLRATRRLLLELDMQIWLLAMISVPQLFEHRLYATAGSLNEESFSDKIWQCVVISLYY